LERPLKLIRKFAKKLSKKKSEGIVDFGKVNK